MRKLSVLVVIALFAGTGCWPFDNDELAEMSLRRQRGSVEVLRGSETLTVEDEIQLESGDVVVTSEDGVAMLRLKGDREVELAGDSRVEILSETAIEGQGGALLASATDSMSVSFGEVEARASQSIFRVDQGFGSTRAAAYTGSVELSAPGERILRVGPYLEAEVAAGDVPAAPDPYRLDVTDPWDREYLASFVRLEEDLDTLVSSQVNQLGKGRPNLAYFQALARGKNVGFLRPYLKETPVVDLLIAFNIALLSDRSLDEAFVDALDFFADGGSWAIVAALLDVSPKPLVAQLDKLFLDAGAVAQGGNTAPSFTVAAATGSAPPQGSAHPPDDGGSDPPEEGGAGPRPRPKPTGEPNDCSGTIDCTVKDLTDPDPDPEPSPSPTDLMDSLVED